MRSTPHTTNDGILTPPLHASNQSEPQMTTNQSDVGRSNSRKEILGEPEIQDGNTGSLVSPSPERDLTNEGFQMKVDKYNAWLREIVGRKINKSKGKQKACIDNTVRAHQKKVSHLHQKILEQMLIIMERCNAKGFVYGMVTETGKPVTGASDSLRAWWKRQIMFDKIGPVQTDLYMKNNSLSQHVHQDNEAKPTCMLLMELSDPTLASILSLLITNCNPPQRKFPFEKGIRPPWWPTTSLGCWEHMGMSRDEQPPFRKPHDLRKKWKVIVLVGILKHMSPHFSWILNKVHNAAQLHQRMNAKECKFWTLALVAEARQYCQEHPYMPLHEAIEFLQTYGGSASHQAGTFHRQNHTVSADMPTWIANQGGVTGWPQLVQVSNNTSTWPVTVPPMGQPQHGFQIATQYPSWYFSNNPTQYANVPQEVQQNCALHTINSHGASNSGFQQNHGAHSNQNRLFAGWGSGASNSGTPDHENQMRAATTELGFGPSFCNHSSAGEL